ncbi:MAG: arylsulfatase [Bacteroidota bacterium]
MKTPVWLCVCWLMLSWSCSPQPEAPSETPPNIIFVMADDLGYGDLGCFGAKYIQTPVLDQMAAEGIRLTQHYAGTPVCAPARAILMTGKHAGHAYVRGNMQAQYAPEPMRFPWGQLPLRTQDTTVAELLQQAGYATGMIGKWGLGEYGTTGNPNEQGFDYFYGYTDQVLAHNSFPEYLLENGEKVLLRNEVAYLDSNQWHRGRGSYATQKVDFSQDLFLDKSLAFIKQHQAEPFFLYLPYTIPHDNGEAPAEDNYEVGDLGEYAEQDWTLEAKSYAAMISRLDADIGRIQSLLAELGLSENTLIVFTSDNGPTKDPAISDFFDTNGPLRGYKRDLYEGGIREPFVAYWPGTIAPGQVSDHPSAFWDFLPTACELAGLSIPAGTDGISYLPTLLGESQPKHEYLYWEFQAGKGPYQQAVIQKGWKAIRFKDAERGIYSELYELRADEGESENLVDTHPEKLQELIQLMEMASEPHPDGLFPNYDELMSEPNQQE